jgi:hypothetical protein
MIRKAASFIPYFIRSLWTVDEHRGTIDMISDSGMYLSIGFKAYSRHIHSGSRAFRRRVYQHADRFAKAGNGQLIRVRLQEISVLGTVLVLRDDEVSDDDISVEVVQDPRFHDISTLGSDDFVLINL